MRRRRAAFAICSESVPFPRLIGGLRLAQFNSLRLAKLVATAALEKKGEDEAILDLRKMDTITDFFVICTGQVDQQVKAIAEHIEDRVQEVAGQRVLHREGRSSLNWVLLDYVDVVVHVFRPAFREFYKLEHLWGDAEIIKVDEEWAASKRKAVRRKADAPSTEPKTPAVRRSAPSGVRSSKSSGTDNVASGVGEQPPGRVRSRQRATEEKPVGRASRPKSRVTPRKSRRGGQQS